MAVLMADASEVSSRENVQYLYNKNVELETKRRKLAQARIPSDPNVWQQMRENFETIILVDQAFAEQHEIELALWQMHYRQIEEIRANINASMAVLNSPPGNGGKTGSARPDRVAKIRSQMKTFLSETTGFYHELMLKIKAKYGLPLGYFSDDTENEAFLSEEGNMSAELKKGLISCHRCLIYLGDLARYKGIYGDDESKLRDFAAASGYYMQASSFWPSSGNPHHQLAILASYSGDEFVAVYRYFRSLAVENPFSMARDNLIIAFEKNRLNFSQLIRGAKTPAAKPVPARMNAKGRARADARFSGKHHKSDARLVKERVDRTSSTTKTFSIKFIRLHGILFSRTSLETFTDVLSMAKNDFMDLLSSQSEDVRCFGSDAAESELFVVRLVAILIFSVHNAVRNSEDQLRAEILQQAVLLEYAYAAAYEFMGIITEMCFKLQDPLSSFLLPGLLVFVEWLACRPEAPHVYEEEKLTKMRAFFWKNCVSIFNKIIGSGLLVEDESFLPNRIRYEEGGETTNYPSLREDFELREYLPLQAAQKMLDFSRKRFVGVEGGNKEKRARGQRIVAAAKTLCSVVRVGEQFVYLDPKSKKFVIGTEPPLVSCEEDEEEEIVFKPFTAADKIGNAISLAWKPENVPRRGAGVDMNLCNKIAASVAPAAVAQQALPIQLNSLNWQLSSMNGFKKSSFMENGGCRNIGVQDEYGGSLMQPPAKSQSNMSCAYAAAAALNGLSTRPASLLPVGAKRSPVSRPQRHAGPPPGFVPVPSLKHAPDDDICCCIVDDYSWLDGYQVPSSEFNNSYCNLIDESKYMNMSGSGSGSGSGMVTFPFPGKQFSAFQVPLENFKGGGGQQEDYHLSQPLNPPFHKHKGGTSQQGEPQQHNQFQHQSLWEAQGQGQFLV